MAAEGELVCAECGHVGPQCLCGHWVSSSRVSESQPSSAYPRPAPGETVGGGPIQEAAAILGLVFGILAILCFILWPISMGFGILGTILSLASLKTRNRRAAIAGLVCSLAPTLLWVLIIGGLVLSNFLEGRYSNK